MIFEQLDPKKYCRSDFDCGVGTLNQYLQKFANQDQRRNLSKIYVLAENKTIVGYYSISAHSVIRSGLPERMLIGGYRDLPFLLLGRLVVDKRCQGQGYGDALIYHAFQTTVVAAEKVGILGMIVDAKDDNACAFYEEFGFKRLIGSQNRLVLPIEVILSLVNS